MVPQHPERTTYYQSLMNKAFIPNPDRWHAADHYRVKTKVHRTGSMPCIGRCGRTVSANTYLCLACKRLAIVQADTLERERAAQAEQPGAAALDANDLPGEGAETGPAEGVGGG